MPITRSSLSSGSSLGVTLTASDVQIDDTTQFVDVTFQVTENGAPAEGVFSFQVGQVTAPDPSNHVPPSLDDATISLGHAGQFQLTDATGALGDGADSDVGTTVYLKMFALLGGRMYLSDEIALDTPAP